MENILTKLFKDGEKIQNQTNTENMGEGKDTRGLPDLSCSKEGL